MSKLEVYNPFDTRDYYILNENGKRYFIYKELKLELCPDGYIPKSGLLYDEVLNQDICSSKEVLDLGCGYLGILGLIAKKNGALRVDAIDYDEECVKWFNKIISDCKFDNINCFMSDYYSAIKKTYDLILSNPPQMPMKEGSLHDSGGFDGRSYILQIMKESFNYLKDNGELFLLMFDFLGTNKRTNNSPCLFEIASDMGYDYTDILYSTPKKIKENSVTYDNIPHINEVYPLYDFGSNDKVCNIQIVRMKKSKNIYFFSFVLPI